MPAAKPPIVIFDASVLVAACVASHPEHQSCLSWLQRAIQGKLRMAVASHTLAEVYSVLSTLPLSPRIGPALANQLVEENVVRHAETIVNLNASDYRKALQRLADGGFSGGITYDMLVVMAAEKVQATEIVTLNRKDFERIAPGRARIP
jgi:predicted nucleic acid-binding protein